MQVELKYLSLCGDSTTMTCLQFKFQTVGTGQVSGRILQIASVKLTLILITAGQSNEYNTTVAIITQQSHAHSTLTRMKKWSSIQLL